MHSIDSPSKLARDSLQASALMPSYFEFVEPVYNGDRSDGKVAAL